MPRSVFAILLVALLACHTRQHKSAQESRPAPKATAAASAEPVVKRAAVRVLDELGRCEVRHGGLFVDLGSAAAHTHRPFHPVPFDANEIKERAGQPATFLTDRRRQYDFWLEAPVQELQVSLRAKGEAANRVYVTVDATPLGARRLDSSEASILTFGPMKEPLAAGRHTVQLQFVGRRKGSEAFAALDWLRLHLPADEERHYVPPTARNLVRDIALNNEPLRSLVLQSPGSVRCAFVPRAGARLKLRIGYRGEGSGVARVAARLGDGQSVVLAEHKVDGADETAWLPLDLSLDAFADRVLALEFSALGPSPTGRVAFGEPELVQTVPAPEPSRPRNVVVVVNAGLARSSVPPWGDRKGLANLFSLSQTGATFDRYRVPSTVVTGVIASLLSAFRPTQHGVLDFGTALPKSIPLLAEALRQGGAHSAFFSNVPYSFEAFGLTGGFGVVETISPTEDRPGSAPLLRAKHWLEADLAGAPESTRLVVIHAAGGHPPWDVTREEAAVLPPHDYNGIVEPRRAAIVLRDVRSRTRRTSRRLGPNDWLRMSALQEAALSKQDTALGSLIETLREAEQWDDTLLVWMGDVAMGDPPNVPFAPFASLTDGHLLAPLIVKFPGSQHAGMRVTEPVTTTDIARTLYQALGAPVPEAAAGSTLEAKIAGADSPVDAGTLALVGSEYAYTLGHHRLYGAIGGAPKLCDLGVDPACQTDLYGRDPFLSNWLWRLLLGEFAREFTHADGAPEPLPVKLDRATTAALAVFGL